MNLQCWNDSIDIKCPLKSGKSDQIIRNHKQLAGGLFFHFFRLFWDGPGKEGFPRDRKFRFGALYRALFLVLWVENAIYNFQFLLQVKISCLYPILEKHRFWANSQTRNALKTPKLRFSPSVGFCVGRVMC